MLPMMFIHSSFVSTSSTPLTHQPTDVGVSIQQNETINPSNPNVHSIEEFNALNKTIESLVVASGSCSDDSITELKMNQFTQLRVLNIGNECFVYVREFEMIGMNALKTVRIGTSCFLSANGVFRLKDCQRVRELRIGRFSFSDYSRCEIESVPSLEVIEIGDLKEPSYNFFSASLELRSGLEEGH